MIHCIAILLTSLLFADQQDYFMSEYGERYDLDGAHPFPNPEVGVVVCRFDFQSSIQDATTGEYLLPDFSFAYSLQEDGVDPATYTAAGHRWIFGGASLAPPEQILSFNSATGVGEGKAFLPLNYVSPQHFWGQPPLAKSWMTVYWGVGSEVNHDGLHPPTLAQGSKVVQLDTTFPNAFIILRENHALVLDQESEFGIVVSTVESFDREFFLSVLDPGFLDVPASVTVPAGAQAARATLIPRQVGTTRIFATSPSYPNVVLRSQKAEARAPVVAVPAGSAPELPGTGTSLPNRYCVHTKPSTPNGSPDGPPGSSNKFCGGCAPEGSNAQDVCDFPLGTTSGFYEPYRCPFTLLDACFEKAGTSAFTVGRSELVEKTVEKCELTGWAAIASWAWDVDKYRICCRYERLDSETTVYLKDCL